MGWWLLRLSAKILILLRLSGNFFQLRLTKKLKINYTHRNANGQFKRISVKSKNDTRTPNLRPGARHSFLTEMAFVTLETDYSCETGYPFDNSPQIGTTS